MKKIRFLSMTMLFVVAILLPLNLNVLNAQTFYQVCNTGQCLQYTITYGSEVSVADAGCMTGDLVIPSTVSYNGITYSVTSIGNNAFSYCSGLTSITIPNSVTSIGIYTFQGCSGLTSITVDVNNTVYDSRDNCNAIIRTSNNILIVGCQNTTIPNTVTSISESAFRGCSGLTSISIPNSVTSIGGGAFSGCSGLTSITIPNSVTSIGSSAFDGCSVLTSITIPNTVTSISDYTFYGCSGLTSITIPNSVTSIGRSAFEGCSGLTSITIPNTVTSISDYTFSYCSGLTFITIPNSVTSIGFNPFEGCSGLTSITVDVNNTVYDSRDNCNAIIRTSDNTLIVGCQNTTIPNTVTSIGGNAFYGCSGLTSITIPNSVTSIDVGAFSHCSGLTSITIPNSVTSIGGSAFSYCSGLTSITVDVNNTVYDSRDNCNAIIRTSDNTLIVGCQNTTIPNTVTSIDVGAFSHCSGLTSITIPNSVTSIDVGAFSGCSGLTSITIPNTVTSIGGSAFSGCSGLTSITIPNSVTSIVSGAFYGCSGLTSITIPNSVTSIDVGAFSHCSGLTSITIPNSVTSIGGNAFSYCSGLTSITIPNTVTSIGGSAFSYCSGLTSITIPNTVTSIVPNTFRGCSGLTSITIPDSVTSIGDYTFQGCSGLTSITIPNSVTSIGVRAFYGCSGLTSITVDANNPVYDSRDNCNAIIRTDDNTLQTACKNTIIPATVTSIGNNAFYGNVGSDTIICLATTPPVLEGCICDFFGDVPDDFRIIIPCGTMSDYRAAWSDSLYLLESGSGPGYETSITVVCPDSCYTWNSETYCTSGDYTQTLQTVHGCDSVVTLHLTITVGINDYNLAASMTVYPNPTTGIVNVQCTMNNVQEGTMEIRLYDAYGRLLDVVETLRATSLQADVSSVQTQIDLSRYAPGVYLIKAVADGNVVAVRKVVKR